MVAVGTYFFKFIFRERVHLGVHEPTSGGGHREREKENPKQVLWFVQSPEPDLEFCLMNPEIMT